MAGLRRFMEGYLPYLLAPPVAALACTHPLQIPVSYHAAVVGSSLTMAAIILGFLSTSLSILIFYTETRLATELRMIGAMKSLVSYLHQSIFWTLLWLSASFLLYFCQPRILLALWMVLACLAITCFLRVVHLLSKLIMHDPR